MRNPSWTARAMGAALAAAMLSAVAVAAGPAAARAGDPNSSTTTDALVVIVDGSGSMGRRDVKPNRMAAVRQAAKAVVSSLPVTTRVGLITYGTRTSNKDAARAESCQDILTLSAVRALTEDSRASMLRKIDAIAPGGWTPIGNSLLRGVLSLPDHRGSVVIVTDGEDTCAPPDSCDVATALKQQYPDVTVSTVGLTIGLSEQLSCIAAATGGIFVTADDAAQLVRRLGVVTEQPENVTLLTPTGYGPAQLGDTYDVVAGRIEGFPSLDEGQAVGGVWNLRTLTKLTYDNANYFFSTEQRLVAIQPFHPTTIDGITVGSTQQQVEAVYGSPIQASGSSALYEASVQTQSGYVVSYANDANGAGSTVNSMVLCLCVPRQVAPTTTTTTLPPIAPGTTPETPPTMLTATGYGVASLGEHYADLASSIDGFPAWEASVDSPALWDLGDLRLIQFQTVDYVFDQDQMLVGIQPDQPLTVDGITLQATAGDVADIYGDPVDTRARQALYAASVDTGAAFLFTYNAAATRRTARVTGIAVCLCRPTPAVTPPTQAPTPEPPATEAPVAPPTPPVATGTTPEPPPATLAPVTPTPTTKKPTPTTKKPTPTTKRPTTTTEAPAPTEPPATQPPAPPVTQPTEPPATVPAQPDVVLSPHAIGDVAIGTPGDQAVAALDALFAQAGEDSGQAAVAACTAGRTVRWRLGAVDIVATITSATATPDPTEVTPGSEGTPEEPAVPQGADSTFVGYQVEPPTDPSATPATTVGFDNGLARGMTWGEWKAIVTASKVEHDPTTGNAYGSGTVDGIEFVALFDQVDGVDPTATPADDRVVATIVVGDHPCLTA